MLLSKMGRHDTWQIWKTSNLCRCPWSRAVYYSAHVMMVTVSILVFSISLLSISTSFPLLPKPSETKYFNNSGTVCSVEGTCDVPYCQEVFKGSPLAPGSPAPSSLFLLGTCHLPSPMRRRTGRHLSHS